MDCVFCREPILPVEGEDAEPNMVVIETAWRCQGGFERGSAIDAAHRDCYTALVPA